EAKTAGVTAIEGVHTNGDLEALKKAAKADLEKAAQAEGIDAVAAVNPVAKDKAKAAALPNTGSRSDSTTAALGLLSIFGAVGLLFSKKKKDDEEA
ncbi:LPXTG cell wall anchor domain-containing protein, partial [Streptococcus pseudopneumoniae]